MEKIAFKMKLNPGMEAEYKRRHDEIWPEMLDMLREAGFPTIRSSSTAKPRRCSRSSGGATTTRWTRSPTTRSRSAGTNTWPTSWRPTPTIGGDHRPRPGSSTWTD